MDHRKVQPSSGPNPASTGDISTAAVPDSAARHPVLSRLIDEVRNESQVEARYDRVHNRHNRGR